MSEKEKMRRGVLYDANHDTTLINERMRCKVLCYKYNQLLHNEIDARQSVMQQIIRARGNVNIESPFLCDYGYNIEVGDHFYANYNLIILDAAKVTFGDYVFVGPNCAFYTPQHPLDAETRNRGLEYAFPISVGNHVWFGGNVVVLPGVSIGDEVVIGAGSIVTKDIPSSVIAAGNPCRVIREITEIDKARFEK